jgi:hypothetical protein
MKQKRENPNWGKLNQTVPAISTEFELQVGRMGLSKHEYASSVELKRWCERNRNRFYVPEWLLKEWAMSVEAGFSDVA